MIAAAAVVPAHGIELSGPEVMKLSWNTRSLTAFDIDGDGLIDLGVLNNDRARIDLLYRRKPGDPQSRDRSTGLERWQPVLEDAPFRRQTIATGLRMFALGFGDPPTPATPTA